MSNAECNTRKLCDYAGVPTPSNMRDEEFVFAVWQDGDTWGHVYPREGRVTQYNPETGMHATILDLAWRRDDD